MALKTKPLRTTRSRRLNAGTAKNSSSKYAFRFSGFSMANDDPYYLVGQGTFVLNADGSLTGNQTSSITKIMGQGAALAHSSYALTGQWTIDSDDTGTATIVFQSATQTLTGTFDLVAVGSMDRVWMISTGARVSGNGPAYDADEVVSGEAIRMS